MRKQCPRTPNAAGGRIELREDGSRAGTSKSRGALHDSATCGLDSPRPSFVGQ
jgi:hypothetical protein